MPVLEYDSLVELGLPPDARAEHVERRYHELLAFLRSPQVPAQLEAWAVSQASHVESAYADALEGLISERRPRARAAQPAPALAAPEPRPAGPRAVAPSRRSRIPSRLLIAVVAVLVVAGAYMVSQMGKGESAADVATAVKQDPNAPVPLDTARVAEWMRTVQSDPSNVDALFNLGESYFQAQQWQIAIDWFTKLVKVDPKNVHAMADIGTANFNLGRFDVAKTSWLAGVAVAPNDVQLHYNLGFLAANIDPPDYATARKEWQTVVDVAPDSDLAKTVKIHMSSLPTQ